jgi:hypothetical protein
MRGCRKCSRHLTETCGTFIWDVLQQGECLMNLYSVMSVFWLAVRQEFWMTRMRDFIRPLHPGQVLDETQFLQKAMLRVVSNAQHDTEMQTRVEIVLRARPMHNRMFKGCGNVHEKRVAITWKPTLLRSHVFIAYFHHLPFPCWCNNKTNIFYCLPPKWCIVMCSHNATNGGRKCSFHWSDKRRVNSCHNLSVSEGDISCLTWKFKYLFYSRVIRISSEFFDRITAFKNMGMLVSITKYT